MASEQQELDLEFDNRLHPGDLAMELPIYLCCLCPCWTCMVPKVRGVPAEATLMPKAEQLQLFEAMKGDWKVLPMQGLEGNMTVYEKATIDGTRIILSGGTHRGRKGRTVANTTQVTHSNLLILPAHDSRLSIARAVQYINRSCSPHIF